MRRVLPVVVLVAAISVAVAPHLGAASALSMNMTRQEELANGQNAAIRYAEALSRLWQLGVNPNSVLLTQTQGSPGSSGYNPMTWAISAPGTTSLGDDGGISEGTVETATVSVSYTPYGNNTPATISLAVIRPIAAHR